MESFSVRRAVPADVDALLALARTSYAAYLPRMDGVRPTPMDDDYAAQVARDDVRVVTGEDGRVVAMLVMVREPDHLLVHNVAVHPAAQGRGVGHRLLTLAEDTAREAGLEILRLYTHVTMVENQRMYERAGWSEVARGEGSGRERVFYEKRV